VFTRKKGGLDVGQTKRGKSCKLMLMVDGNGISLSTFTLAANHAEVNTLETLVDVRVYDRMPDHILYDKAADADWLRERLLERGTELVCPHRNNRTKPPTQDGRKLRRYRRRWIVERVDRPGTSPAILSSLITAANELIDLHELRLASIQNYLPTSLLLLLLGMRRLRWAFSPGPLVPRGKAAAPPCCCFRSS
jgi:hypothetical protein